MKRALIAAATALALSAFIAGLVGTLASASGVDVTGPALSTAAATAPTTSSNEIAAHLDTTRLLLEVRMPAGSTRSPREPAGDGGWLAHAGSGVGTSALVDRHRWWIVHGDVGQVLSEIGALRPHGATGTGPFGTFSGPGHSGEVMEFTWPQQPGVLSTREVVIEAVNLGQGETGVRPNAQDVWVVVRPATERLPAGINRIRITSAYPADAGPFLSLDVTSPSKVAAIVSQIDSLQVAEPGAVYACPMVPAGLPTVTFTFDGGAVLARATVVDDDGQPSGPCSDDLRLVLGGVAQRPLVGDVIPFIQTLLGINLDPHGPNVP